MEKAALLVIWIYFLCSSLIKKRLFPRSAAVRGDSLQVWTAGGTGGVKEISVEEKKRLRRHLISDHKSAVIGGGGGETPTIPPPPPPPP